MLFPSIDRNCIVESFVCPLFMSISHIKTLAVVVMYSSECPLPLDPSYLCLLCCSPLWYMSLYLN